MMHYLTLGYFDPDAVKKGQVVLVKPLDMNIVISLLQEFGEVDVVGKFTLGGQHVKLENGYLVCPWLTPLTNVVVEAFARKLHHETNCLMADIRCRKLVSLAAFD